MENDKKKDQFLRDAINKMLSPYGVDVQHVVDNPEIDSVAWYQYFTWSKYESDEFKKWFVSEIRKRLKISKQLAEREFVVFNLMWGLKEIG